jgi:hypothetical protein
MSGNYWRLDAPTDERAIAFTIEAYARSLVEFARNKTWQIRGTIDAEGLASGRELEGSVSLKLVSERRVPYRLSFVGDDRLRYELIGQKEWSGLAPIDSLTILPASLFDASGAEIGRATLRFDTRADWASWMRSFRLRFGGA